MDFKAFIRMKKLEEIYSRMSDDDKRLYVLMTMQDKSHEEIMKAIEEVKRQADKNHHSFTSDLLANISGNAIFDSLVWIGSKLIR